MEKSVKIKINCANSRAELTNTDDIELKPALQQFLFDLLGDAVKTDMTFWENGRLLVVHHGHCGED